MARRKRRVLTEVELEFMQVLWRHGELTTEQVVAALREQGRELTGGSVRKILSILERKGYVERRRKARGKGFLYTAKVPREQANSSMVLDLLRRAFGGSAALMVTALLGTPAVSHKDIEEIRQLIGERRGEEQK